MDKSSYKNLEWLDRNVKKEQNIITPSKREWHFLERVIVMSMKSRKMEL